MSASPPERESSAAPGMSSAAATAAATSAIRRNLLRWYDLHQRPLPWRKPAGQGPPDAYHVLVSEFMLQQTQVATVIPYFRQFVHALPTVHTLAAAPLDRVLALWQGLGYYRRARNLHAAACAIVQRFGQVPDNVADLLALPGVGRYTAGAIASLAFGRRAPIVDGNVRRVLTRLRGLPEAATPAADSALWADAEQLVPPRRPGDFNSALMELGATVCTPRNPACPTCPLRNLCNTYKRGHSVPSSRPPAGPRPVIHAAIAVCHLSGKWLLTRRPPTGRWASLWQSPTAEGDTRAAARRQLVSTTAVARLIAAGARREPLGQFTHLLSHRRFIFTAELLALADAPAGTCANVTQLAFEGAGGEAHLVSDEFVSRFALSRPQHKALEWARAHLARSAPMADSSQLAPGPTAGPPTPRGRPPRPRKPRRRP